MANKKYGEEYGTEAPTATELITYLKNEYKPKEKLIGVGFGPECYYFFNKSEVEDHFLGADIRTYGPLSDEEWEEVCSQVNNEIGNYVGKPISKAMDKMYAKKASEKGLKPKDGRGDFETFKSFFTKKF